MEEQTGPHRIFKHYTDSRQDLRTHKTYLFRLVSHRNLHLKTFSWYLWRFDEHRRLKLVFLLPFHRWGRAGPFHHKRLPLWSWGVATSAFWLMFTLTIFSRFSSLPFFSPLVDDQFRQMDLYASFKNENFSEVWEANWRRLWTKRLLNKQMKWKIQQHQIVVWRSS